MTRAIIVWERTISDKLLQEIETNTKEVFKRKKLLAIFALNTSANSNQNGYVELKGLE